MLLTVLVIWEFFEKPSSLGTVELFYVMIPVNTNIHGRVIGIKDVPDGFTITLQAFLRHVSELIFPKNEATRISWQQKYQKERNDLHGEHWGCLKALATAC